jgi:hypothetical protein
MTLGEPSTFQASAVVKRGGADDERSSCLAFAARPHTSGLRLQSDACPGPA